MKEVLVREMRDFLSLYRKKEEPLLVAYSGGVDSAALLSILLECRFFMSLDIRILHFDHAWREESAREAEMIKEKANNLGIPFYSARSDQNTRDLSNKEERAREERYAFFKKVHEEVGVGTIVLAHQREDLAETVLKRFLEGAGALSLGGMEKESFYKGMRLWRPLLSVPREDLLDWNRRKNLSYFIDSTNEDTRFLRPGMRKNIFPLLEEYFGKGVRKNMAALSEEFFSLKRYMKEKLRPLLAKKVEGPLGFALLAEDISSLEPFEKEQLIRAALLEKGVKPGRETVKKTVELAGKGSFDKKVDVSSGTLIVDRGSIFWLTPSCSSLVWEIREQSKEPKTSTSLLRAFFEGELHCKTPEKGVVLTSFEELTAKDKKKMDSFFSQNKIPATMRKFFPFVRKEEGIVCNFVCFNLNCFIDNYEVILNIKLKNISN